MIAVRVIGQRMLMASFFMASFFRCEGNGLPIHFPSGGAIVPHRIDVISPWKLWWYKVVWTGFWSGFWSAERRIVNLQKARLAEEELFRAKLLYGIA